MIYNNTAITKGFNFLNVNVKDFISSLTAALRSKKKAEEAAEETDGYIELSDIIQQPRPTSDKYFMCEKDLKKIKDIYCVAVMTETLGISEEEYENLFKYFRFKFFGYDASGYTMTERNYYKFYAVYCDYTTAFYKMTAE
ncbi:MAG: hypothetical protein LUG24_08010 [Clostridiales bacterium]|nr:hypothetical protein [Clostridiales bacterium]